MSIRGDAGLNLLREADTTGLIYELIPTAKVARNMLKEWRDSLKVWVSRGSPLQERTLSADSWRRLRTRFRSVKLQGVFDYWPEDIARCFEVYLECIPEVVADDILKMLRETGLLFSNEDDKVMAALGELSGVYKKCGDILDGNWKYWVDLHLLCDYKPNVEDDIFVEEIKDWVSGDRKHTLLGSEELFYMYFEKGLDRYFRDSPIDKRILDYRGVSIDDFAEDPSYWAVSGSSTGRKLRLSMDGKLVWAKNTKWASAMELDSFEVKAMVLGWKKQLNGIIQKRERGKVRAVISGELELYLQMGYVGLALKKLLKGHEHNAMFMSSKQMLNLWTKMARGTVEKKFIRMPLDQSKFDREISKRMVVMALDKLADIFTKYQVDNLNELIAVLDRIKYSIDGGHVKVGNLLILYEHGVLSGWGLTAFLDSLINAGELLGFTEYIHDLTGIDVLNDYNLMGDDDLTELISYPAAALLWSCYEEAGFLVNPRKFFISTNRDEYLREVAFDGVVAGYPARAVGSLVFRNPVNSDPISGMLRVREEYGSWKLLFDRSGVYRWDMCREDVSRGNGISITNLLLLEKTPAAVGGLGLIWDDTLVWGASMISSDLERDWTFARTPPAVGKVAAKYNIDKTWLTGHWLKNVVPRSKVVKKLDPDKIELVKIPEPISNYYLPLSGPDAWMTPRPDYSKYSEIQIAFFIDEDPLSTFWMTEESKVAAKYISKHCSRRVYIDWVRGKLPWSMPIVSGVIAISTSTLLEQYSAYWWTWVLGHWKVSYSLVERAAVSCEKDVRKAALTRNNTDKYVIMG